MTGQGIGPGVGPGVDPTSGSGIPVGGATPERAASSMPGVAVPQSLANPDVSVPNAIGRLLAAGARPWIKPTDDDLITLHDNLRFLKNTTPGWFDRFEAWITGSVCVHGRKMDSAQLKAAMDAYPQAKQKLYDNLAADYEKYKGVSSTKEAIEKDMKDAQIPAKKALKEAIKSVKRIENIRQFIKSKGWEKTVGLRSEEEVAFLKQALALDEAIKSGKPVSRRAIENMDKAFYIERDFLMDLPPECIRYATEQESDFLALLLRGCPEDSKEWPQGMADEVARAQDILIKLKDNTKIITREDLYNLMSICDALREICHYKSGSAEPMTY